MNSRHYFDGFHAYVPGYGTLVSSTCLKCGLHLEGPLPPWRLTEPCPRGVEALPIPAGPPTPDLRRLPIPE
jgi:hypothetical protein